MPPSLVRAARLACCGLVVLQPACTYWHTEQVAPAELIERHHPLYLRVTLRDSVRTPADSAVTSVLGQASSARRDASVSAVRVQLDNPALVNDTLVSLHGRADTVRVALADVTAVQRRRVSPLRTIVAVLTPVAVLFGVACLFACGFGTVGL